MIGDESVGNADVEKVWHRQGERDQAVEVVGTPRVLLLVGILIVD